MQAVLQKDDISTHGRFDLFNDAVDIGDFIQITGTPYKTKRGERSIKVSDWTMAAKSLLPIPDEWYGLKDEEKILRERYLDILLNEFVTASGRTEALVTLTALDVRPVVENDLVAVRSYRRSA